MIYILRFSAPLGSAAHQANYYVGWCNDGTLDERLAEHRAGRGAAITRACVQRGIDLSVALVLPGGRDRERQLKRQKNTPRLIQRWEGRANHDRGAS